MLRITKRRGALLASGIAVLALTGSGVAGVVGSSAADDAQPQVARVTQADAAARSALAAFRRPAQAGDLVPYGVRSALYASEGVADVNPDLGRAVGPAGGLYLLPGDGKLCLGRDLDPGSVVYCADDAALADGEFVGAVVHTAGGLEVSGIVGDGASAARVETTKGAVDVDVVDGAVLATVGAPPVAISWRDRDGARRTQTIGVGR